MRNLITDVDGVSVGLADEAKLASGVTVVVFDEPAIASAAIHGGAPAVHDGALLEPHMTVEQVDAFVLSGGSAFGLDAAAGVKAYLSEIGRGLAVGAARVPIVPGAALFDLSNGGDKAWGRRAPYADLAYRAARNAGLDFALGSAGAGLGATTCDLKGGLGSASARTSSGFTVGAIVAVNAVGRPTIGSSAHFWAGAYERNGEFGGLGWPAKLPADALDIRLKGDAPANTNLAVVATDAVLTKPQAKRLAMIAQTGMARAIYPVHAPLDGDVLFAAATCERPIDPLVGLTELGMVAANVLSRAIARSIFCATALPFAGALPAWKDRYG